ncbi:MAG TPA: galactokinase [Candidatus Ventricola intestinavium]|nr:galactokinase [Candidatus Ventricola intestinavium]
MISRWDAYRDSDAFAARVATLYGAGEDVLQAQKARYGKLVERFEARFGAPEGELFFFSAPGRTEIGGNHTDHNNGRVLAAAVNLDTVAFVQKTDDGMMVVDSEGFPPITVDTANLAVNEEDFGTTLALIRGTAGIMREMGYAVGGFRATVSSSVLRGSGLSSSAAFEVLIAAILDGLYNGFVVDAKQRAVIAQKVENVYFGKPCGLMDQMASSVGGMVTIDFAAQEAQVEAIACDFAAKGYALCVVNTGGNHGDLTDDYAAIRVEMEAVANQFGRRVLRDVPQQQVEENIGRLRGAVGERAILRALHFYDDNERVLEQVAAIREGNLPAFFDAVNRSGDSSWKLLQNVYARPTEEQMALAIEMSRRFLKGEGAQRVHGGGFAGTIQAYVPLDRLQDYVRTMEAAFGRGCCTPLMIRPEGAVMMPVGA